MKLHTICLLPLLAALATVAAHAAAAPAAKAAAPTLLVDKCMAIEPARPDRVGEHWLLVQEELQGRQPPKEMRVASVRWTLLDETAGKLVTVDMPLAQLVPSMKKGLIDQETTWSNSAAGVFDTFSLRLRWVSDDGKRIAVHVRNTSRTRDTVRFAVGLWTVGSPRMELTAPLADAKGKSKEFLVHVGVDAAGQLVTAVHRRIEDAAAGTRKVELELVRIDPATASVTEAAHFATPLRANEQLRLDNRWRFSADRRWLAVPEYSELDDGVAAVHVVDLSNGANFSLPSPPTTYALDFSPDGKTLLIGSHKRATLELWDLATRKKIRSGKGPERMHSGFFAPDGKVIWTFTKAGPAQAYLVDTLAKSTAVSAEAIFGKGSKGVPQAELDQPGAPRGWTMTGTDEGHGFGKTNQVCMVRAN